VKAGILFLLNLAPIVAVGMFTVLAEVRGAFGAIGKRIVQGIPHLPVAKRAISSIWNRMVIDTFPHLWIMG